MRIIIPVIAGENRGEQQERLQFDTNDKQNRKTLTTQQNADIMRNVEITTTWRCTVWKTDMS